MTIAILELQKLVNVACGVTFEIVMQNKADGFTEQNQGYVICALPTRYYAAFTREKVEPKSTRCTQTFA